MALTWKDSCPVFGKKYKNCSILGHFSDQCKKKSKDMPDEHHKPAGKQNHVMINKMKMKKSKSNNMGRSEEYNETDEETTKYDKVTP